ncbi:MAG: LptF/LptG family permease [Bacteroidota bacterium]
MLKILDRYIIRKFLTTFFFMMAVIMLLAMVFDLAERLSDFIANEAPVGGIITSYYVNFILFYGNMFSPMIIFVSVIWFTAKMANDAEIIPILNSGRTFQRFLRPYMIVATLLMFITLVLNHFVIPRSNAIRLDFEERYYRDQLFVEDYHAEYPGNQVVYFSSYSNIDDQFNDFILEQYDASGKELKYLIKARYAKNIAGTQKWVLRDFYERNVGYYENDGVKNDRLLEGQKKDTIFKFNATEMVQRNSAAEAMTYYELKDFIARETLKGSGNVPMFEIELYKRTSMPFATYILTLIGVSVSSKKRRGGVGINIAIGLLIIFIYIFAMQVTTVAAMKVGFTPSIAVWVPNVIFGAVALILYRNAQK